MATDRLLPLDDDEACPDGKQLWFARCAVMHIRQDEADTTWAAKRPMDKQIWQRTADLFLRTRAAD